MRQRIFALLLSLIACAVCGQPLQSQTTNIVTPDYDKQYYFFASPTLIMHHDRHAFGLAVGGGVERFLSQRITVGLELADSVTRGKFINSLNQKLEQGGANIFWGSLNGAYSFR